MEHQIICSKSGEENKSLKEIISKLICVLDIECIYLSPLETEKHAVQILIVLLNHDCGHELNELKGFADKIILAYPVFNYRLYYPRYVEEGIKNGNLFFIHGCTFEKMVFCNPESENPFQTGLLDSKILLQRVRLKFKKEKSKTRSFMEGASFYLEKGNCPQAAFMMHQTIELLFRHAELFMMGRERICHRIRNHQKYIMPFVPEWGAVFNMDKEEELSLLTQLDDAYMAVRYDDDYQITKEQLSVVQRKAEWMHENLIELFDNKLALFEKECQIGNKHGNEKKKGTPLYDGIDNPTDETATLQGIQELTKKHFELLEPHTHKEGMYRADFYVEGYLDLLFTVSHLIKVCILALETEDSFTPSLIPEPKVNIGSVLELTLQLLPYEEGEYLDKIRELLLNVSNINKKAPN